MRGFVAFLQYVVAFCNSCFVHFAMVCLCRVFVVFLRCFYLYVSKALLFMFVDWNAMCKERGQVN
jgi:hypothetical protein